MKRTPLRRKTELKRTPFKRKTKRHPILFGVLEEVCKRDGGIWIEGRCIPPKGVDKYGKEPDWRGWQFSHNKHRGMGGRFSMNTVENLEFITAISHDLKDGRANNETT